MATGTTIMTTTNNELIESYMFEPLGPYYANGYWWLFSSTGSFLQYASSTSLTSGWSGWTVLAGVAPLAYFAVTSDGTNFHVTWYTSLTTLKYAILTTSGGTLSQGTSYTVSANVYLHAPTIIITSDGHICISTTNPSGVCMVFKNSNTISSGVWSTAWSVTVGPFTYYLITMAPGPSGSVYCLLCSNSSVQYFYPVSATGVVGNQETATLSSGNPYALYDISVDGNGTTHVVYTNSSSQVMLRSRSSSGVWDVSETQLLTSASPINSPIQYDPSTGLTYFVWTGSNQVSYRVLNGSSLSPTTIWLDESGDAGLNGLTLNAPVLLQNGRFVVVYMTKSASPYNIKVATLVAAIVTDSIVASEVTRTPSKQVIVSDASSLFELALRGKYVVVTDTTTLNDAMGVNSLNLSGTLYRYVAEFPEEYYDKAKSETFGNQETSP